MSPDFLHQAFEEDDRVRADYERWQRAQKPQPVPAPAPPRPAPPPNFVSEDCFDEFAAFLGAELGKAETRLYRRIALLETEVGELRAEISVLRAIDRGEDVEPAPERSDSNNIIELPGNLRRWRDAA
jgi:hypothetical protein